jgi:uncharacterized protein
MTILVERVREGARRSLNRSEQSVAHRADHIERVMWNAALIASTMEDVDNELLELAVLLHDVNQPVGHKQEHVRLSIHTAAKLLRQAGCTEERVKQVLQVIAEHSTEHIETVKPASKESRILFDADKLDGLGAAGIARVFALFGQMGQPPLEAIPWYRKKIAISLKHVQTESGRRLFESRRGYVEEFLRQMEEQAAGPGAIGQVGVQDSSTDT